MNFQVQAAVSFGEGKFHGGYPPPSHIITLHLRKINSLNRNPSPNWQGTSSSIHFSHLHCLGVSSCWFIPRVPAGAILEGNWTTPSDQVATFALNATLRRWDRCGCALVLKGKVGIFFVGWVTVVNWWENVWYTCIYISLEYSIYR